MTRRAMSVGGGSPRLTRAILLVFAVLALPSCTSLRTVEPGRDVAGHASATNNTQAVVPGLPGYGGGCFWPFVNMFSGQLFAQYRVVAAPAVGWPWDLCLYYNSLNRLVPGPFGRGWSHSYGIRLTMSPDSLTIAVRWGDGRIDGFTKSGSDWVSDASLHGRRITAVGGGYQLETKNGLKYQFDSLGRLTGLVDRNSNAMTYAYDGLSRLITVADASGRTLNFTYGGPDPNLVTEISGFTNQPIQFFYAGDLLAAVSDPQGFPYQYVYDGLDRLIQSQDGAGRPNNFEYYPPPFEHVIRSVWAAGAKRTYEYDGLNRRTTVRDSLGPGQETTTSYRFDVEGRCAEVTDGPLLTAHTTYDPATNGIASHTDADGRTTTYSYDALGNLLSRTYADGSQENYTYDPTYNLVLTSQRRSGGTTTYTYDGNGNLLTRTDPLGAQAVYTYTAQGQVASFQDERGLLTTYAYDPDGNLISETSPSGQTRQATYDGAGALLTVTDRSGITWTITRNARREVISIAEPTGGLYQYSYTPSGRLDTQTDPLGATTTYTYDALDRLVRRVDPMSGTHDWTRNGAGWVLEELDAVGSILRYVYDAAGRVTQRLHPGGSIWSYNWGACDLVSATDALGIVTTYQYDSMHRRIQAQSPGVTRSYTYDGASRMITAQLSAPPDPVIAYTFAYDALDRRIATTQQPLNRLTTWLRDPIGHVTRASDNLRPGIVTWGYNANNKTASVTTTSPGFNALIQYTPEDRVNFINYSNGVTANYSYDASNRLIRIQDQSPSHVASYDPILRDPRGNAIHIDVNTPAVGVQSYDFAYDPNGNILNELFGATVRSYAYDALNRRIHKNGPSGFEAYSYSLDHWLLSAGARTQTWNANGAVINSAEPGMSVNYSYRSDGALRTVIVNGQPWGLVVGPFGEVARIRLPGGQERWFGFDFAGDRLCRRSMHSAVNVAPLEEDVFTADLDGRGVPAAPVLSLKAPFLLSNREAVLVGPMGVARVSTGTALVSAQDVSAFGEILGQIGPSSLQGFGGMDQAQGLDVLLLALAAGGPASTGNGGSAVVGGSTGRWGDYGAMSVDPADAGTFWYTGEYHHGFEGGSARTMRVGSWPSASTPYHPGTGSVLGDGSFGPDFTQGGLFSATLPVQPKFTFVPLDMGVGCPPDYSFSMPALDWWIPEPGICVPNETWGPIDLFIPSHGGPILGETPSEIESSLPVRPRLPLLPWRAPRGF